MITIDVRKQTYVCPFCGHAQAYGHSHCYRRIGYSAPGLSGPNTYEGDSFDVYSLKCNNAACGQITILARNHKNGQQIDLVPQVVMKSYPDYIPQQIRHDYEEANLILEASPKAAATLLRRCLQGMIRDFWKIKKDSLNSEISAIQDKVTFPQWNALDGLRKLGNIGAHMEKDVNLIIDIDPGEAKKLLQLIELLLDKWYIARHDEEKLCTDITQIASEKDLQRKAK